MSEQLKQPLTPDQQQEAYELVQLIGRAGKTKDGKFNSKAQWRIENNAHTLVMSIKHTVAEKEVDYFKEKLLQHIGHG